MLPHWLGLIGEAFNLAGAVVLALDVFLREKERLFGRRLERLHRDARSSGIKSTEYKGVSLSSEDFVEKVLHRRSVFVAYCGATLLGVGFFFLGAYHALEIWETHHPGAPRVQKNEGFATIFRLSESDRKEITMSTTTLAGSQINASASNPQLSDRPVVTRVLSKFQLTVPPEVRALYDLREGDLLEWQYDEGSGGLLLFPKRAELITPQLRRDINAIKTRRKRQMAARV